MIGLYFNCKNVDASVHDSVASCVKCVKNRWLDFFQNSLKIYTMVHVTIALLRFYRIKKKWKQNKGDDTMSVVQKIRDIQKLLIKLVTGLARSCCFTSTFATSIPFANCFFNRVLGEGTSWSGILLGFIFSNGIWFENSNRWGEISLYVLAQWFEGYFVNYWGKTKFLRRHFGQNFSSRIKSRVGN